MGDRRAASGDQGTCRLAAHKGICISLWEEGLKGMPHSVCSSTYCVTHSFWSGIADVVLWQVLGLKERRETSAPRSWGREGGWQKPA